MCTKLALYPLKSVILHLIFMTFLQGCVTYEQPSHGPMATIQIEARTEGGFLLIHVFEEQHECQQEKMAARLGKGKRESITVAAEKPIALLLSYNKAEWASFSSASTIVKFIPVTNAVYELIVTPTGDQINWKIRDSNLHPVHSTFYEVRLKIGDGPLSRVEKWCEGNLIKSSQ